MNNKQSDKPKCPGVAIQGVEGSFHDIAARKFFYDHDLRLVPCNTFKEVFSFVKENKADIAIAAIENSLTGSLLANYNLLKESQLKIIGEVYLRVEQNIIALHGQNLEDIQEVHSHPLAIIQCDEFLEPFRKRGVKIVDAVDTALSARWIAQEKLKGIATLASAEAAQIYGLTIIERGIELNKRNFTRFLIIAAENSFLNTTDKQESLKVNKASICFSLLHKAGSLSQVLSVLAFYNVNLTKIQSTPIIGREWEYFFYVDLIFSDYKMYIKALSAIDPLTDQLQILGEYMSNNENGDKKI